MKKIKLFTGTKICKSGDIYKFKNGIAIVSGCRMKGKPLTITIKEFLELNKGEK